MVKTRSIMEKSQFVESHIEITRIDPEVINSVVKECEKKGFYLYSVTALNDGTVSDGGSDAGDSDVFGFSFTASVLLVFRKDQAKSTEFEVKRLEDEKTEAEKLKAEQIKRIKLNKRKIEQEKIKSEKVKAEADKLAAEKLRVWLNLK